MKQNLPLYDTSSKKYGNNNFKRTVEADIAEKSQKTGQLTHTHSFAKRDQVSCRSTIRSLWPFMDQLSCHLSQRLQKRATEPRLKTTLHCTVLWWYTAKDSVIELFLLFVLLFFYLIHFDHLICFYVLILLAIRLPFLNKLEFCVIKCRHLLSLPCVGQHMLANIFCLCDCGFLTVIMECDWTEEEGKEEPRMLGLALIPGRHVVSICIDASMPTWSWC